MRNKAPDLKLQRYREIVDAISLPQPETDTDEGWEFLRDHNMGQISERMIHVRKLLRENFERSSSDALDTLDGIDEIIEKSAEFKAKMVQLLDRLKDEESKKHLVASAEIIRWIEDFGKLYA